jgi:hypothetical protein
MQVGQQGTYFAGAITRAASNKYYILDQIGKRLIRTDTLNNQVNLGAITGLPLPNITGITWDAATGTMYAITSDLIQSQIGTLDTATRIVTPIGSSTTVCPGGISISASPGGSLFVVDIVNDNLYRFNKTTGVPALVGSLGVNTNFGQDAQFDVDGILYWAAYTSGPQLRTIDTATGSSAFICGYTTTQAMAIATIPYSPPVNPISRSFIWLNVTTSAGTISKHFLNSCTPQLIIATNFFPGGAVFAGPALCVVHVNSPYQLYTVDTTSGIHTLAANVTRCSFERSYSALCGTTLQTQCLPQQQYYIITDWQRKSSTGANDSDRFSNYDCKRSCCYCNKSKRNTLCY